MDDRPTPAASLVDVPHAAPRLYECLPQCSRQTLLATCSHLHKLIRERTTCVTIRYPEELSWLVQNDWPDLTGILLHEILLHESDFGCYPDSNATLTPLQGKWHLDAQVCFGRDCDLCMTEGEGAGTAADDDISDARSCKTFQQDMVLIVSPWGNSHQPNFGLTLQQCQILSQSADRQSGITEVIAVGPQQQPADTTEISTASSTMCMPSNLWFCFGSQAWPKMYRRDMRSQKCDVASAQGLVRCSFPVLQALEWSGGKLDATVCAIPSQADLSRMDDALLSNQALNAAGSPEPLQPFCQCLDLANNNLDPVVITASSKGSLCKTLCLLDGNALGEKDTVALGKWQYLVECSLKHCSITSHAAVASLAQVHFPSLMLLHLTGNFEAGAVAWFSGAQWPSLELVSLGFHELDKHGCSLLGICNVQKKKKKVISHMGRRGYVPSKPPSTVLPNVRKITVENIECFGTSVATTAKITIENV